MPSGGTVSNAPADSGPASADRVQDLSAILPPSGGDDLSDPGTHVADGSSGSRPPPLPLADSGVEGSRLFSVQGSNSSSSVLLDSIQAQEPPFFSSAPVQAQAPPQLLGVSSFPPPAHSSTSLLPFSQGPPPLSAGPSIPAAQAAKAVAPANSGVPSYAHFQFDNIFGRSGVPPQHSPAHHHIAPQRALQTTQTPVVPVPVGLDAHLQAHQNPPALVSGGSHAQPQVHPDQHRFLQLLPQVLEDGSVFINGQRFTPASSSHSAQPCPQQALSAPPPHSAHLYLQHAQSAQLSLPASSHSAQLYPQHAQSAQLSHPAPLTQLPWRAQSALHPAQPSLLTPQSRNDVKSAQHGHPKHGGLARLPPATRAIVEQAKMARDAERRERTLVFTNAYSRSERQEIQNADIVGPEPMSQDSSTAEHLPRTKHNYVKDGFAVDDSEIDELKTDTSLEDEAASLALGSDMESSVDDGEAIARDAIVTRRLAKLEQPLPLDSTEALPLVTIVNRTGRSRCMELILNAWSRIDVTVNDEDVCLFLKLLRLLPQECQMEVYKNLIFSVRVRSVALYVFVYGCIKEYLPEQEYFFKLVHLKYLEKAASAASAAPPATPPTVEKSAAKKPKPTVPKPVLRQIHDIASVVKNFFNEFQRYEHDHKTAGYQHCSLFGCLTPDQQASLCSLSGNTIASMEAMDTESQLDVFRRLFGTKSSAAAIQELTALQFTAEPLEPASWSAFLTRFKTVLNKTPRDVRPPQSELARRLVYACPLQILKADVQARKPESLDHAFEIIMGRLNDPGFLRSVASSVLKPQPFGQPRRFQNSPPQQGSQHNRQRPDFARGGNERTANDRNVERPAQDRSAAPQHPRGNNGEGPRLFNDHAQRPDSALRPDGQRQQPPPNSGHNAAMQPRMLPRRAPCGRCRKTDHPEHACISKHDVDGKRLEPLPAEQYQQNKTRYFKLKEQIKAGVDCEELSPVTSDVDEQDGFDDFDDYDGADGGDCNDADCVCVDDGDFDDVDCVCALFAKPDSCDEDLSCSSCSVVLVDSAHVNQDVPAPPLVCVEKNPGPWRGLRFPRLHQGRRLGELCCIAWLPYRSFIEAHSPVSGVLPPMVTPVSAPLAVHLLCALVAALITGVSFNSMLASCCVFTAAQQHPSDARRRFATHRAGTPRFSFNSVRHPSFSCTAFICLLVFCAVRSPPAPSLLLCGDVESNPGPPIPVTLSPSTARPPRASPRPPQPPIAPEVFLPRTATTQSPAAAPLPEVRARIPRPNPVCFVQHCAPEMPGLRTDSDSSDSADELYYRIDPRVAVAPAPRANVVASALPILSADRPPSSYGSEDEASDYAAVALTSDDSSVTSDPDLHDLPVCAAIPDTTGCGLLPPPKFIGFPVAPGSDMPPPPSFATICAVDTMCLGNFSIISRELVESCGLPCTPFQRTSRTASGALVRCSASTVFLLAFYVSGHWLSIPVTALVWDCTSQPLLLCNAWALSTGFIDIVQPNAMRTALFGSVCFSLNWEQLLDREDAEAVCAYHADVMNESDDDVVDLSAPLRVGDQDISSLPEDAKAYALRFMAMTKALPRDAHPALEKWRAHIVEEDLAKYSWPKCNLKDLKEDKLPSRALPAIHAEFDKLIAQNFAEELTECPTSVVMKAQLVAKTKTDKRFCVNGSVQKNVLRVGVYPMPSIRNILAFVASFPWRAKIDLKWGYYNFEIHPEDRKWTVTIGGGRAIQWRKVVQGFASSGAFFQYAMTKLLGPDIVGKIAEVYLDDLIIVGATFEECMANVEIVMGRLSKYNFRVHFAKCQFTPRTTIDFLGCRIDRDIVYPGPKVSTMLAKILPFHAQLTPKAQRHHLHVFLGMCTYLLNHCPGLKQALHLLYVCVASEPFRFGDAEKDCFARCHKMLLDLKPYHLPSSDPDVIPEIHSDASGGAGTRLDPGQYACVLGQRRGVVNPVFAEGFEVLQLDGGSFNETQAKWDILKKECFALYRAFKSFRHFIFGRRIRVIVDSKVLMHMHRSAVPMVQRWFAYIQQYDFELIHFSTDRNCFADALTRCVHITPAPTTPPAPRLVGIEPNPGPSSTSPLVISSDTSLSSIDLDDVPLVAPVTTRSAAEVAQPVTAPATPVKRRLSSKATPAPPAGGTAAAPPPSASKSKQSRAASAAADTPAPAAAPHHTVPAAADPPTAALSPTPAVRRTRKAAANARSPTAPTSGLAATDDRPPNMPPDVAQPVAAPAPVIPPEAATPPRSVTFNLAPSAPLGSYHPWPALHADPPQPSDAAIVLDVTPHICPGSPGSFFYALSKAIDDHDRRHLMNHPAAPVTACLPHDLKDIRNSVVTWMRHNAVLRHHFFGFVTLMQLREQLYAPGTPYALASQGSRLKPANWGEYLHLLLQPETEADELVMKCAASAFRCQITISMRSGTHHFCPPHAARRAHLLFEPSLRHFNWCHLISDDACVDPTDCAANPRASISFDAPALSLQPIAPKTDRMRLGNHSAIPALRRKQIAQAHCGFTGHPGIARTIMLLDERELKWRGRTAHVTQFIAQCPTCMLARVALNPAQAAVSTLRLLAPPLKRWHCDSTGALPVCKHTGFDRITSFICESTGYIVLAGSRFNSALEVTLALVTLVGTFGLFESFHSDGGSENDGYILHMFEKITGIKHTAAIPANPNSNGIAESAIKNVKRFLRQMIADGLTRHDAWGLMLPIIQQAINATPCGPLRVPPNAVVFASLWTPESFVVPTLYFHHPGVANVNVDDGNYYTPSANFVTRAIYFQQLVTNSRHEVLARAMKAAEDSPAYAPETFPPGSQILIPWPDNRRPTSLHAYKRGPYIVTGKSGNVLDLVHAVSPVPDGQPHSLRWSANAHVYSIDPAFSRVADDPSSVNSAVGGGTAVQHAIECILSCAPLQHVSDAAASDVKNQVYSCRLFGTAPSPSASQNFIKEFYYEDIKHTLALDLFVASNSFLTGHTPVASMPPSWDPRAVAPSKRPSHYPVLDTERAFPVEFEHSDDSSDYAQ